MIPVRTSSSLKYRLSAYYLQTVSPASAISSKVRNFLFSVLSRTMGHYSFYRARISRGDGRQRPCGVEFNRISGFSFRHFTGGVSGDATKQAPKSMSA